MYTILSLDFQEIYPKMDFSSSEKPILNKYSLKKYVQRRDNAIDVLGKAMSTLTTHCIKMSNLQNKNWYTVHNYHVSNGISK